MTVTELRRCRSEFDRPTCPTLRCGYADPDGSTARRGRAEILAELTRPADSGCGCPRCVARARPFTAFEAEIALSHVTDRQAVAYALGLTVLGGCVDCERCGGWVPSFHTLPHTPGTLADGRCPFHR